jgi:rhodanese-related sulfurtransferase/TusA-related sulfurtransferase
VSEKQLRALGRDYAKVFLPSTQHVTYYPGAKPLFLKLLFERASGRVLGAQAIGEDGADKRIDVISTAIAAGLTVEDLEYLELCYAPPYGAPKDAVNMAGAMAAGVRRGQKHTMYPEELDGRHDNLFVLDTRSPEEFEASCIPGSVNIPDEQVRACVAELPRDRRIAIVCQIGVKANNVQRFLELQGYDAYTVMGGYTAWMMAMDRLPVPRKANRAAAGSFAGDRRAARGERRQRAGASPTGAERRARPDRRGPWRGAELDARGLTCPGPILKLRERMNQLGPGEFLLVRASDPAFPADLEAWAPRGGAQIVHLYTSPNESTAICRKRG